MVCSTCDMVSGALSPQPSSPKHSPQRRAFRACFFASLYPVFFLAISLSGCLGGKQLGVHPSDIGNGDPGRGKQVIEHYGCGKCHTIPGIHNARGVFGPPLNYMGSRTIIAGEFPNFPSNLTRWVQSPSSMKPKTAMPDLGLTEEQARDAAAYLETLH